MRKYYYVSTSTGINMVVNARNEHEAKNKFIHGDVIDYYQGWDNSDWKPSELNVKRVEKLDKFDEHDSFHIIKYLISNYNCEFEDIEDSYLTLNKKNYSDERLRKYLKGGYVDEIL